jgi:hypothetical protein
MAISYTKIASDALASASRTCCDLANKLTDESKLAGVTLLISLLALLVSARGCQLASDSHLLATNSYRQDRKLILKGGFSGSSGEIERITVSPVDDSMAFLSGTAFFPRAIVATPIPIAPDGSFMHTKYIEHGIQDYVVDTLRQKGMYKINGKAAFAPDAAIPVLIDSIYAAKNEPYSDRALYALRLNWVDSDKIGESPLVYPVGLVFIRRISPEIKLTHEVLDKWLAGGFGANYGPP